MLVALLGIICLVRTARQPFCGRGLLPLLLLFYLAWCLASTMWSSDVPLTLRRLGVLVFCFIGALGVGRQFSLRQICVIALLITATYMFIGLGVEICLGTFKPWHSGYRFSGTVHPNLQASYCSTLCLAAICLLGRGTAVRSLLVALLAAGIGFLLLTQSRTTALSCLVAVSAMGCVRSTGRQRIVAAILFGLAASTIVLAMQLGNINVEEKLLDTALMGRSEESVSLNGRIPLWMELSDCCRDRLLIGFGYGAFWDPEHVEAASAVVGSGVSHSHSAYIETLVNVGLVGAAALALAAATALVRAARACRHARDAGYDFLFVLLVYGAVQSVLESMFSAPACIPFLAACGLARLAFCPAHEWWGSVCGESLADGLLSPNDPSLCCGSLPP